MKPKIPLYFTVVRKHGSLYFICGDKIVEVHGKSVGLLEKLLPFLDGKHDFEEILRLTKYPKERVKSIIRFLSDNSIVFDDDNVNHFKLSQNDINANTLKTLYFASIGNYSKMYEPTKRLKNSSVFLVGLGAVGSRVASSLALNGVGKLFASDSKEVGPADIELGPYTNRDAGTQRGEALRSIVSDKTELHWVKADLSDKQFLDCLNLVDLVVCCSENRSLLYRSSLNRMCVTQGKPWLNTAVYEDHGEVGPTVIPYMSPCFDCYYPQDQIKHRRHRALYCISRTAHVRREATWTNKPLCGHHSRLNDFRGSQVLRKV